MPKRLANLVKENAQFYAIAALVVAAGMGWLMADTWRGERDSARNGQAYWMEQAESYKRALDAERAKVRNLVLVAIERDEARRQATWWRERYEQAISQRRAPSTASTACRCPARTNNDGTCDARYNANKVYIASNPQCRKR